MAALSRDDASVVAAMTEAAIQRSAAAYAAQEQEPGFLPSEEVREGVAYEAMQAAQQAHDEALARDVNFTRELLEAPEAPFFMEPRPRMLGATGFSMGGSEQQTLMILDGARLDDLDFPNGPVFPRDPPFVPPGDVPVPKGPIDPGPGPGEPDPPNVNLVPLRPRMVEPAPCDALEDVLGRWEPCEVPPGAVVEFEVVDIDSDWNARMYRPPGDARCPLVVLLPGSNGVLGSLDWIATSYAQAGYRTLTLETGVTCTVRRTCANTPSGLLDDANWNACLVTERMLRLLRIFDRLVRALEVLENRHPAEGWGVYLTRGEDGILRPEWSRIIAAGYSAGANQTAFHTRFVAPRSVILYSGGGDGQRPPNPPTGGGGCPTLPGDSCRDTLPADWMSATPLGDGYVGYRHQLEPCNFSDGWTLDNVDPGEVYFDSDDVLGLADFLDMPRLVRTNVEEPQPPRTIEQAAHETATERSPGMRLAHVHLVCQADGRTL